MTYETTKYIPMRRCMNCDHATECLEVTCPECGSLFVQQATEEEIEAYKERYMANAGDFE